MNFWVVYFNPLDAPGRWVVRRHTMKEGATLEAYEAGSLEDVREFIPEGMTCIPREDWDEPQIVETWI